MPSPPLRFLKTFQLAARLRSFKAAGEQLCITASAVSHQIKALEDELGLALFDRGPRSLTLTAAGLYYLEHLDAVFSRLDYATQQLRMRHTREVVRVQVPPFFASEWLVPRLAAFSACYADTDLQIATDITPRHEHSANFDVSIIVGRGGWEDVQATRLFEQTYVPACTPGLQARWCIARPADLALRPLITHDRRPDLWERWAAMAGVSALRPTQLIHFDTMSAVVHAAEQGIGIALVSAPLAQSRFQSGGLLRLFDQELETGESYYLVTRAADADRQGVANLIGWMLRQFSGPSRHEPILAMDENR